MLPHMTKIPHTRNATACGERGSGVRAPKRSGVGGKERARTHPHLLHGLQGLLLHQLDVEGRGQDEDEHGGGGGTWRAEQSADEDQDPGRPENHGNLDQSGTPTRSQKCQTFENRPGIIAVSARTPSDNGVRTTACGRTLTDEAEDVAYAGDEDDQDVGSGQQDHGDDGVADPAELLLGAQQVVDRRTDLCEGGGNRLGPV